MEKITLKNSTGADLRAAIHAFDRDTQTWGWWVEYRTPVYVAIEEKNARNGRHVIYPQSMRHGSQFRHVDDAFAAAELLVSWARDYNFDLSDFPIEQGLRFTHRLAEYLEATTK